MEERKTALEEEYFHRQEKELIEKMKAKLAAEQAEASGVECPKCDGHLTPSKFDAIEIDVCNKCGGVWLDPGELTQIAHHEEGGWFGKLFK
jgi:hypothetical protein